MLRVSERKQMDEEFMQGKGTGLENFGSNPMALEVSSAVSSKPFGTLVRL